MKAANLAEEGKGRIHDKCKTSRGGELVREGGRNGGSGFLIKIGWIRLQIQQVGQRNNKQMENGRECGEGENSLQQKSRPRNSVGTLRGNRQKRPARTMIERKGRREGWWGRKLPIKRYE